jgi:hypothetical protein
MTISRRQIEAVVASMFRQGEAARNSGGIALRDVADGNATVPQGWKLDPLTCYFLPANVVLL